MCCLNGKVRICGKIRTILKNVRDESCMTKMDTYRAFICFTLQRFWNCRKRDVTIFQWILPHFIRYRDSRRSNATNLCFSHQSAIDLNSTGRYSERLEATSGNIRKLQPCVVGNVIPALWKRLSCCTMAYRILKFARYEFPAFRERANVSYGNI